MPETLEEEATTRILCDCKAHRILARAGSGPYTTRSAMARAAKSEKLRSHRMKEYSYAPEAWNFLDVRKNAAKDRRGMVQTTGPTPCYLGVELETSARDDWDRNTLRTLPPRFAIDLARPRCLWIAKPDASVSGPEYVSQPATLDYWHSKELFMRRMLRDLIHAGYRSHDTGDCGMHISISSSALRYAGAQYAAMLCLLADNQALTLALSQRTHAQVESWARILDPVQLAGFEVSAMWRGEASEYGFGRYTALNIPTYRGGHASAGERIEFRLPRGTLLPERYYKNLEWAHSLVAFTEREMMARSNRMTSSTAWVAFVKENVGQYPNLAAFLRNETVAQAIDEQPPRRISESIKDYMTEY